MASLPTFFPLKFSASMLESMHKCQTSFFREYIQHLSGFSKNPDLIAGGHIAKACEIVRNSYFNDGLLPAEAIELGKEYILDAEDTGDSTKSNENVAYCLGKYFQKFKLDEALPPCKLSDGTHAVEYKFDFDLGIPHPDLPDRNITFTGRLDYLCEKVTIQRTLRYGLDEKSCKQVYRVAGSKIIDYAKEAAQYRTYGAIIAYAWAAQQLGITLESFLIRRIPIMSQFEPAFELEIPITQYAIDIWFKTTHSMILEFVEKYKMYKEFIAGKRDRFPQEVFYPAYQNLACLSYSRQCRFMEGCTSKDGEYLLTERFSQRIYDRDNRVEVPLIQYLESLK